MYRWLCGRCKYIHSQHTVYLLFSISFHRPSPLSFSFRFTSLVSPLGSLPTHPSLQDSKLLLLSGRSVSKHLLSQYFEYIICLFLSPPLHFFAYIYVYIYKYKISYNPIYKNIYLCVVWFGVGPRIRRWNHIHIVMDVVGISIDSTDNLLLLSPLRAPQGGITTSPTTN